MGCSARQVPAPHFVTQSGTPLWARSLAPAGAPARRCSAEPWDGACSCILPPEPGTPHKGPPKPNGVRKPSLSPEKKSQQVGKILPRREAARRKASARRRAARQPFPPRTWPACAGLLPEFEGRSSPVCSRSAGERKTNGLICAKSRLQLQHLLFSSSQYFIPLQIRMNAILLLKSFSVLYAEVNAVCPAICIFKGISNTGFLFHRENKIDLRAKPE